MGLFDYVTCEYPLPEGHPEWMTCFQTKDLGCDMSTYIIGADGRIPGLPDFTGTIDFYGSNITGSGPGLYTANGDDARSIKYRAVFVDGKLIELVKTSDETEPAVKREPAIYARPTAEEKAARNARESESLLGKDIFVQFGGGSPGFLAKVVAENSRRIVAEQIEGNARGEFTVLHRSDRDSLFFDSERDAIAHRAARKEKWEDERRKFDEAINRKRGAIACEQ